MSPTLTTFLFEAANVLILAVVLGWLFFKPVRQVLEDRRRTLALEAEQASEKLAEAERLRAEIAHERERLSVEFEKQRAQARAEAEKEAQAIVAAARDQARREREAAQQGLASLRQSEGEQLARAAAAAAREVVARLLAQMDSASLNEALVRAASRELAHLDGGPLEPVTVESAQELSANERAALAALFGSSVSPRYRVVPDLIAGIRVITGRGMVDASVAGLAAYAERVLATRVAEDARE